MVPTMIRTLKEWPSALWARFSPRERTIQRVLAEVQPLLAANRFDEADKIILREAPKLPGLLSRYDDLYKLHYVATDVNGIASRVGFEPTTEQAKAITATGQNILVKARAGSGKTSVIALKFRQLIEQY